MKELDVYMRGTVLRYDVPVVDPDAETDVYVRPSTYYIDAYINELTAKAEIGVHNVLLIYSTLLGGIVSVPTSGKATGITIKTSLGEAFREVLGTVYPVVAVSSESSPATLSKFATIESQGF